MEFMTEEEAIAMAAAGTVAVLLPVVFYVLHDTKLPPMHALGSYGRKIALATYLNLGPAPRVSLRVMLNMACRLFRMTP